MPIKIDVEEVVRLRRKRKSWRIIADFVGCSFSTIRKFVRDNRLKFDFQTVSSGSYPENNKSNIMARSKGYRNIREMVTELRRQGKTIAEISKITGLHQSNVKRYNQLKGEVFIYTDKKKKSDMQNLKKAQAASQKLINEGKHKWQTVLKK